MGPVITLLGKPGCHLCDDARDVIAKVAGELGVRWEERDITTSAADTERYWEQIPVTLIDGVRHDFWRVDETRLRKALLDRLARPGGDDSPAGS
ncbi:MAG TPA: glutaredoxin family protein [Streptosporangiaceae bacterium]|nr:glutaredoxin family protein [Streptosporangiaceae bacterium]